MRASVQSGAAHLARACSLFQLREGLLTVPQRAAFAADGLVVVADANNNRLGDSCFHFRWIKETNLNPTFNLAAIYTRLLSGVKVALKAGDAALEAEEERIVAVAR